jgi:hypothetical protein
MLRQMRLSLDAVIAAIVVKLYLRVQMQGWGVRMPNIGLQDHHAAAPR